MDGSRRSGWQQVRRSCLYKFGRLLKQLLRRGLSCAGADMGRTVQTFEPDRQEAALNYRNVDVYQERRIGPLRYGSYFVAAPTGSAVGDPLNAASPLPHTHTL